jgi:hypothetical protein
LPEPLAEAGVGSSILKSLSSDIRPDLPLPRRGVLSGKSPRTSRRWRLFLVRFVWAFLNRAVEVPGILLRINA